MTQITVNLDTDLAKQWNKLASLIGDQNILFSEFIEYHKRSAQREIARMEVDLATYEDKYKMSSEDFYNKFDCGELDDTQDFVVWSGIYEMQLDSKKKLAELS